MPSGIKKDRFKVENFENGDYVVIADVFDKNLEKKWTLANVYGPAHDESRESFMSKLSKFCFKAKYPMLMGETLIF
jgi:hypothetical protein